MGRSNMYGSVLVVLAVLMAGGCSTAPTVKADKHSIAPADIHKRVQENIERIRTLSGTGTLSIESPEMAGSGSFVIMLRKPDSLMIRLEGPFGIEVGSALVTREDFVFYNSLKNQLITGPTNSENLAKTLRMKVTFDDLMNLFTGASFLAEDTEMADDFTVEDDQYVMTYRRVNATRMYWIDPEKLLITKIQHLDSNGKLVAEQRYAKYQTTEDGMFPSSMRYTMNAQRRILSVFYDTVNLNTPVLSFTMDVPLNATHIRIE